MFLMLFADLKNSLKEKIAPVYIAAGTDVFLINKSVELILAAAAVGPLNVVRMEEDAAPDTINAALQNVSMFGGATAVVIRGLADTKIYLQPTRDLKKAEKIDCNPMAESLVVRLIMQNKKYTQDAAQHLARVCDNNFSNISNEMQKLDSYYFDKSALTPADIDAVVTKTIKYQIFELTDAISKRDTARVNTMFDYLEQTAADEYSVFAMLMSHCRKLFFARASLLHDTELGKYLGVHPYSITVMRRAQNINSARAAELYAIAIEYEYQIKSGKILPWRAALLLAGQLLK
jgi:DNA polymerase III delta subunit